MKGPVVLAPEHIFRTLVLQAGEHRHLCVVSGLVLEIEQRIKVRDQRLVQRLDVVPVGLANNFVYHVRLLERWLE